MQPCVILARARDRIGSDNTLAETSPVQLNKEEGIRHAERSRQEGIDSAETRERKEPDQQICRKTKGPAETVRPAETREKGGIRPDELIVEGLWGQLAAQLVGLLHLGQHLDHIHHAHRQLLGHKQLVSQVLLQGHHHTLLQQWPWVLCPPLHQTLHHNRHK